MKNKIFVGSVLSVLCGLALPPVATTTLAAENAAEITGSRLSADLARADRGAHLDVRGIGADAAQVLIGKDPHAAFPLPSGTTSMILSLPKIEIVNHFDFVNGGGSGNVTVSVSSTKLPFDSTNWREVVGAQAFSGSQLVPCDLGSVEARYVKIDFNAASAGKVSGFNLFGASAAPAVGSKSEFHVSIVTPANGNVEGSVTFDAANPAPKVVADLGDARILNRLTCSYEAPAGTLSFYLVDDVNAATGPVVGLNYVGEPTLQPVSNDAAPRGDVLAGKQPIYAVNTAVQPGSGKVTADLGKLQGHYLVAAFRRHHSADGKDVKDGAVADYSKGKDAKEAPVFPAFTANPPGFGNPPTDGGTPLVPPGISGVKPPPLGNNSP